MTVFFVFFSKKEKEKMKDDFGKNIRCESEGKICYTKKEAGTALNRARHHDNRAKKIPKRMYPCKECGHYHLTSKSASHKKDRLQEKYRYKKEKLRERENKDLWRKECSLLYAA